jgi:hypothetical protein
MAVTIGAIFHAILAERGAGAPWGQAHACYLSVVDAVNAGPLHWAGGIRHECGARSMLSHRQRLAVVRWLREVLPSFS